MNYKFNGMEDMPNEREQITSIINDLIEIRDNQTRHLADVGLLIKFKSDKLTEISKAAFAEHEKRKAS